MKKYVIQWRDKDGFSHFVPGELYGVLNGIALYDTWNDAANVVKTINSVLDKKIRGKPVVTKRRLFGSTAVRYEKLPEAELAELKRIKSTMRIVDINVNPKPM